MEAVATDLSRPELKQFQFNLTDHTDCGSVTVRAEMVETGTGECLALKLLICSVMESEVCVEH